MRLHWEGAGEPREEEPSADAAGAAGGPPPVGRPHPAGRLDAALLEAASRHPDRTVTAGAGGTRTYGELAAGALTVARFLERHPGWRPRDRVGLVLDSGPMYAAAFHGVLLAGGVAVPIPPTLPRERIGELLEWTDCTLRFEDGSRADGNDPRLGLPVALDPPLPRPGAGSPDDLAAILLTSGSTGPPKGVMLSRGNLYSNADAIRRSRLRLRAADRALVTLPVHHAFGNSVLQSHLLAGSRLVFDPDERSPLGAIARHRITALYEVPDRCVLLERSLRRRKMPESLRFLAVAGGRLAPRLALGLAEALASAELVIMYGQTEATA
ncbi:MAG TPA: AMP-binding protein, partial [Gemmatimonadota bacterium]|nr:AMP-binding protein [Gemmatimonadota bacterium]